MKKAFTLIELVFVIVIFGIVAVIGSEILLKVYDNYLRTRSQLEYQQKLNLASQQISLRLKYAIFDSLIVKETNASNPASIQGHSFSNDITIYEWIGRDNESLRGDSSTKPGWSGFVDLYSPDTNATQIKSSGSNFSDANNTINALSYGTKTINDAVIIFSNALGDSLNGYGFNYIHHNHYKTFPIVYKTDDILEYTNTYPTEHRISEKYDLAWTAYALVLEGDGEDNKTLKLYYNYQPWKNERYYSHADSSILVENVSKFYMTQENKSLHFELCIKDPLYPNLKPYCQEKGVY